MRKIKVTPIKSITLCEKCVYFNPTCSIGKTYCRFCDMYNGAYCRCDNIIFGMPCKYFIKSKEV